NLLDSDAVLAGDAAAERDARLEDLPTGGKHASDLSGVALVEQQDRMDVAVARMEHVADAQLVTLGRGGDRAQNVWYAGPRHHAVLRAIIPCQPADRPEGALAGLPEQRPLGIVASRAQLACT